MAKGKDEATSVFFKMSDLAEQTPLWGNSDLLNRHFFKRADLELGSLLNID